VAADSLPPLAIVQNTVRQHFAHQPEVHPGELISRGNVEDVFAELERQGWKVADKQKILDLVLPDNDPLVTILRSPPGAKFMGEVSRYQLIYDRLDRVVHENGGRQMLQDLVKLPDAARYAKFPVARGLPNLIDFLPKGPSGKTRQIRDYDQSTGKLYTAEAFLTRIETSYKEAQKKAPRRSVATNPSAAENP